jgi:hypothetical protein
MSILKTAAASRAARLTAIGGLVAASVVALSTSTAQAAGASLSPAYGPGWATTTVSLTAPGLKSPSGKTINVLLTQGGGNTYYNGIYFSTSACSSTIGTSTALTSALVNTVNVDAVNHMVLTVPSFSVTTKTDYNLCVYGIGAGNPLLTTAKFSAYPRSVVASGAGNVTPVSGPSTGGQTITVEGTNLTSNTKVTLGGVAATNVKVAKDGLSLTATTPATAAGAANLVVTNEGGSSLANTDYSSLNAITVSPNTAAQAVKTNLTIKGKGFGSLSFVPADTAGVTNTAAGDHTGTNSQGPHIYLVSGAYSATGYNGTTNKNNGQVSECLTPIVQSDTLLTCVLDTGFKYTAAGGQYTWGAGNVTAGTYTITIVDKGDTTISAAYPTALTSGATFTVAPF